MQFYSQLGEDQRLWNALQGIKAGFYVDVGAWDPVADSVTKVFYDHGWSGINIEPTPRYFERLQQARPRDRNLQVACGDSREQLPFYVFPETGLSTLRPDIAHQHRIHARMFSKEQIEVMPLRDILLDYCGPIQFLKIDAEGSEEQVIRGMDWNHHRPLIVVVEAVLPLTETQCHEAWEPFLLAQSYCLALFDGVNRFYVRKGWGYLAERLAAPIDI